MDIREISISGLGGKVVGFFSAMNGGKTRAEVSELDRAIHSGHNVMACNSVKNTRDGNFLVVDGRPNFPATQFNSASEIREEYDRRMKIIMSYSGESYNGSEPITIGGIKYRPKVPITVIGIDEINLFCLTEKEATETVELMRWAKKNNIYLPIAGLCYDFRQRPFGHVSSLMPYVDIKWDKKPVCKAVHFRKPCGEPALHTQRLWSTEFVSHEGLESFFTDSDSFDFEDKSGNLVERKYVPAPFFDRTVKIESSQAQDVYLPVCDKCARMPFKEETFAVYDRIVNGGDPNEVLPNQTLTQNILNFLSDELEGWVRKKNIDNPNDKNKFIPIPYHRNRLGGYSPG